MNDDQAPAGERHRSGMSHGIAFVAPTALAATTIVVLTGLLLELGRGAGFTVWLFAPALLVALLTAGAGVAAATAPRATPDAAAADAPTQDAPTQDAGPAIRGASDEERRR